MKFRKVYVNSSHRTSGTSTKFHYQLPLDVECPGTCHVAVTSVCLPNSMYSVQQGVNDKLYIYQKDATSESSSVNSIITISAGNYSATTLNTAIQQGLTAAALGSASYACKYNSVTQKMTISQASGGGFSVYDDHTLKTLGRKDPSSGGFYGTLPVISNPQSLQQTLNLPPTVDPNVVFTSGVIIMARVLEAYLRSPNLTNFGTLDSMGRQDVLKRVPVTSDFETVIVSGSNIETSDLMDVSGRTLRALDFMLTDSHANTLDMHGHDWSFCLNFVFGDLE